MIDQNILTALQVEAAQQAAFAEEHRQLAEEHTANAAKLEEVLKLLAVKPASNQKFPAPISASIQNSNVNKKSYQQFKRPEWKNNTYLEAALLILSETNQPLSAREVANRIFVNPNEAQTHTVRRVLDRHVETFKLKKIKIAGNSVKYSLKAKSI